MVVGKVLLIKITKGENEGPEKVFKATSQQCGAASTTVLIHHNTSQ